MTKKLGVLVAGIVAVLAVAGCQTSVSGSSPVVSSTVSSSGESSVQNGDDGDCTFEAGTAESDDGYSGGDNIGNEGNCSSFGNDNDNDNDNGFGNGYGSGRHITIR